MNKKNNNFKYLFLIIINLFLKTASAATKNGLDVNQYNCMVDLFTSNQILNQVNLANLNYNFCDFVKGFQCNTATYFIEKVTLNYPIGQVPIPLITTSFACIPTMTQLVINNFDVGSFISTNNVKLQRLELNNCTKLYPLPVLSSIIEDVYIFNNDNSHNESRVSIDFSSIINLRSFTLVDYTRNVSYTRLIGIPTTFKLSSLTTPVAEIPILTNMNLTLSIFFNNYVNRNSFINFNTFNLISSLTLSSYSPNTLIPFPFDLQNIPTGAPLTLFISHVCFEPIVSNTSDDYFADFSNLKKLILFGALCNSKQPLQKSYFPIKKLQDGPTQYFYFEGYNFHPFSFDIFSTVAVLYLTHNNLTGVIPIKKAIEQDVDLSNNQYIGRLDDSYCTSYVNVSNNVGINDIPTCFSCHWSSFMQPYFRNISFVNSNQCNSIIPNLKVETDGLIILYGKDLGFSNIDFETTPSLIWKRIPSSKGTSFSANYSSIANFGSLSTMDILYYYPNKIYTVSLSPMFPEIYKVKVVSQDTFDIYGKFFTYNITDVSIEIGDLIQPLICYVSYTSFDYISCSLENILSLLIESQPPVFETNVIPIDDNSGITIKLSSIKVSIGSLSSKVYFTNTVGVESNNSCIASCPVGQYCSLNSATCVVPDPLPTSPPPGNCKNNCSGNGVCLAASSLCVCNAGFSGEDCSGKFCSSSCSADLSPSQGLCNNVNGECECFKYYTGSKCELPNHFVSSNVPCSINGGTVLLYGWFGTNNTNVLVHIGDAKCMNVIVNSSQIQCTIEKGSIGIKSINVTQNSIVWYANNAYEYINPVKQCSIPNCNNHGTCNQNTGKCECSKPYSGYDCLAFDQANSGGTTTSPSTQPPIAIPESKPVINTTTGSAEITNEQTNYKILLKSIVELDFSNNVVFEYILDGKWSLSASKNGDSVVTNFTQTINNTTKITSSIEDLSSDKNFTFAGIDFTVKSGSVKVSVEILNWSFLNSLNTLQLRMESLVSNDGDDKNNINKCNLENDETNVSSDQNPLQFNSNLNNVKIERNAKILYGRFLNRALSDGRPTFITNQIVSNSSNSLIVGINLPHCNSECVIDPDFSVLVSSDFKSADSCSPHSEDSNRKWVLPVSIVVSVCYDLS
ncbi:hypothetical protein DDB_G0291474 [Dictyostelium discoideum AX4]|uniref:EGF-like domain-containing protein n=1 Tax=Dictyostelium discoideum TaxID=44689 RepID=Q54EK3_DICDI|nr:hypothetical protein DDB_G0291474 [Dictyostelium discoideum AX4]EAL61721.1 hypothetical protein DDB_G0291474 [Dictyostelium discoideum AX4]|eukprot:XP_635237.1 hypothetical protein DDB_G0291474 [Dictyostelium discoideum AX4]